MISIFLQFFNHLFFTNEKHFVTLLLKCATQKKFYSLTVNLEFVKFDTIFRWNCLSNSFIYSGKPHVCLGIHTRRYLFLELTTAAEITNHTTTPRRDSFSTWQHSPALSSSAMTHISLSVSRRGGVQNDALAWKILFEGTFSGLTEQPDRGGMSWYCHSAKSFFVSAVGCGTVGLYSFSLEIWKHPLSIGHSVRPAVRGYEPINTEICPVCCCNSPGSCCPAESWWGCCWGWTTGRVLLWCGEPLRFLTGLGQFREEGPVLLKWRLKGQTATVAIGLQFQVKSLQGF